MRDTLLPRRATLALTLLIALSSAAPTTMPAQEHARATAPARIDWATFLGRHDLVWDRLPRGWGESVFIGNGVAGATIDAEGGTLGWTINRTDVTHDASRFPIGRVTLRTAGALKGGTARLTLHDGEASGVAITDSGEVRWRSFVARTPSVIVVELEGRGGERAPALDWSPAEARPPRKIARKEPFAPEDLHPAPAISRSAREIVSVQSFIGGDAHAEVIREASRTGTRAAYHVAIGFAPDSAGARGEAQRTIAASGRAGTASLAAATRAWWHAYYPASFVSFPDRRLEGYYWIQIYKLGAAMRPDGPILDLAGPWYRQTPWPGIWWNLNIQLTYSPLFRANRLELAESLFGELDRKRQALIDNVPERLRGEAAAIGRSSGNDLVRKVDLATAQSDAAHEMGDLPWTLYYYWLHYRYQMDDRILRDRVYPLLGRAIGNYLAYLERGNDGRWHLPPTHSPELATVPDANYDLALLRWGLQTLVASAEHLKIDDPRLPRWRDVLAKLTPFPADSSGLMVGRGRPWKESHRHYSHLLAIYPLALITPDSSSGRALIERSLATWEREQSLFRGYSFTGGASMHAMLGDGNAALVRLNAFLDAPRYMEANTFYAESGPVIETPLSAATTMQELFLQDWGGVVRVFPAIPDVWPNASFDRLRADGAFLVSGVRSGGRAQWVRVVSLAGAPLRLKVSGWDSAVVRGHTGPAPRMSRGADGVLSIALARGASVTLAASPVTTLAPIAPVALPGAQTHAWPALKQDSAAAPAVSTPAPSTQATAPSADSLVPLQDRPELQWWRESMKTRDQRLAWWRDARFGMFIHWGVYSQLGGVWKGEPVKGYAEHIQRIRKIPAAEYRAEAVARFDPVKFNADEWVRAARGAGMRYMIITAKHHDGFAMYDSKVSDYNVVRATPFARDPLRELRDAAKRQNVRFGFYYSHAFDWGDPEAPGNDWEYENPGGDRGLGGGRDWWTAHPELVAKARRYVDRKAIPQIVELIRNYDPDIMWFDTPHKLPPEENLRILRAAREAKPTLVINGRAVQPIPGGPEARFGDYASTADRPAELTRHDGDWEAIPTTNESYGYHQLDRTHKPSEHFVRLLAKAAARGGNLLLNIGPMGDGRMDARDLAILEGIGNWMAVNAEAIRGTTRTPLPPQRWGESTRKGDRLYLLVSEWPRDRRLHVAGLAADPTRAWLLNEPNAPDLVVRRTGPRDVEIEVPRAPTDPWVTVIALEGAGTTPADSALFLDARGAPTRLHVFDGRLVGSGVRYGDGKRNRDVATGWSDSTSGVQWLVRTTARGRYRLSLEYATAAGTSTGAGRFAISAGDARLGGAIAPTGSDTIFATRDAGELALDAGEHTIVVRATAPAGAEPFRLRRLVLVPATREGTSARPSSATTDPASVDLARVERGRVLAAANRYLRARPVTVTATRAARSAGGAHDFYSEGDYWWPDPASVDSPYVRRDGETNPANFVAHRDAMRRLSQIVPALVAAYELTGDERYARAASAQLRAWFVSESTRMNPHLLYGQAVKGRFTGRGTGIIDTIHLVEVARAVTVLEALGAIDSATLTGTRDWFRAYLEWMTTHRYGVDERNAGNNHSAAWALQVAEFARLAGDSARRDEMRRFFRETLVPEQMDSAGGFPRELARTKPYGYSLFQLDVMAMLAESLSGPGDDLWTFTTPDGRGMRRALAFMVPYIEDRRRWPKPPDVMHDDQWPIRHPALYFGGRALGEPRYVALWRRLPADPAVDEVIRNYPVRQPLLWFPPARRGVPRVTRRATASGLAATPPMGWNSWNRFHCDIDERLIRETADAMVASGMRDAGYVYLNIDDCWEAPARDASGNLAVDSTRFPGGMKALADYVHARGLKLGIYSSAGTLTCQKRPASLDHEAADARTFAAWGIDYLKYDNCNNENRPAVQRYTAMGDAIRASGRPMVYSLCEWGQNRPWEWGRAAGAQLWRTTGDISDRWSSVMRLLDRQVGLERYSGPNAWNDPDMLEVGNGRMTNREYVAHFSLWALLNAPLIAGNDVRTMSDSTKRILMNREVIAVDQDWGGTQGYKLRDDGEQEVWMKPMSDGARAVVLLNRDTAAVPIAVTIAELGLGGARHVARDLWAGRQAVVRGTLRATVPGHGAAMYLVRR